MIVYHVCSFKKLSKYKKRGSIKPPVRAWENMEQANRMSISTGCGVILRLKFPENCEKLEGHFNEARVMHTEYSVKNL